ncbi:hypothetical protein [Nocardia asteroides]|uniref:hypothetical protein n=1 Tax=Nocardia asteroides TaxID=1824 RepID=UPI0034248C84
MKIDQETVDKVAGFADLDDLYALLGNEVLGEGWGASAEDDEERRRFGSRWFEDRVDAFREKICGGKVAAELTGDLSSDIVTIASLELPFANDNQKLAVIIAAIIARRGLAAFCAGY